MMMGGGARVFLVLLFALALSPAFMMRAAAQAEDAVYTEAFIGEVRRLNPLLAAPNSTEAAIASLLFEGLFTLNRYGEIAPQLAEEWLVSADGLEYVVWLRGHRRAGRPSASPPALWHDGLPVSARDVEFTMSLLRARDFPGDERLNAFWRTVETQALSEYALRFRLTQPLAGFRDVLRVPILPEHALRGSRAADLPVHPFNLDPIGSGPYQLAAIRGVGARIDELELQRAPNYRERAGAPYALARIRFRRYEALASVQAALANGEVDGYAGRHYTERAALLPAGVELHSALAPQLGMLLFQWENETLANEGARRALRAGLDVPALIERALPNLALPATGPLPANSREYAAPAPTPRLDIAAAREALAIDLPETDADGYRLRLRLLLPETPEHRALAQGIAAEWAQLDALVMLDARSPADYQAALAAREFDLALIELDFSGSADPDVYAYWHEGQKEDGLNYGAVADRDISQALERARQAHDTQLRREAYAEFQRAFAETSAAIPLYSPLFTYAVSPAYEIVLPGYLDSLSARFREIGHWSRRAAGGG